MGQIKDFKTCHSTSPGLLPPGRQKGLILNLVCDDILGLLHVVLVPT
jgi:hypothetical protein